MEWPYTEDADIVSILSGESKHDYDVMRKNPYMTTYQDRLSRAMSASAHFNTPTRLAKEIGCSSQAISQALSGSSKKLGAENHSRAAQALCVSPIWLANGAGDMTEGPQPIPIPKAIDPVADALSIIELVSPAKAALFRAQIMAELEEITKNAPIKKDQQSVG